MNKSIYLQIFVFAIIVAFMGSFNSYAQITTKDVHKGKYSNQTVPQGQNIPTPYQGDLVLLFDNGPMITHPGGGFGGADASALQTALGMGTYGFGQQISAGNTIADDVIINDEVWTIDNIQLYGYQTGSPTTSTINDVRLQIWQNLPNGGGTVVWGDLTTNVLTTTNWTNIYRTLDTDLLASNRPIMEVNVAISPPLVLQPGEYWLQWEMGGTLASGPWQPPVTIVGSTTTGNALNSSYVPLVDVGPQGAPFLVFGTPAPALGPGLATNPSPANGATGVLIPNQTLSWTNPGGATSNDVYFGTDPLSMTLIHTGSLATSVPVTGLVYNTQYFWRVDEIDGTGTTTGILWNFTTEPEPCPILELPISADFEDIISLPPDCWTINTVVPNPLWLSSIDLGVNVSGYGEGLNSACAIFYFDVGIDELISIEYNSTGAPNPQLTFDWAYADYSGTELDEMDIYYSTDGGSTWTILAAMVNGAPGDDNLNPFGLSTTSAYVPLDTEWSTRSLNLPANTTNVKFTAVSAFGNLLWLDNILISGTLYEDGFENPPYVFPGQVALQNPTEWTTWGGTPGGADDATISTNYAYNGAQSALIDYSLPRWVDLVKPLGNKTSGKWYISFFNYIPTGKTGYFNTLASPPLPDPPGPDWAMEVYFDVGGGGRLMNVPGAPINFTWTEDVWHQVLVVVDFTQTPTTAEFWFGKVGQLAQLFTWDWTQGGTITDQLGGNDFFAPTGTSVDEMYIDDYYFSDVPPPIQQLADDVGVASIDMDYQYAPGTITPLATVKNYGTADHSFDVLMTITPGGYSQTVTSPSLLSGETAQITFPNWTETTVGAYTVDVTTQLVGDGNSDNDNLSQGVHLWDDSGDWTSGADYPITTYNGAGVSYNDGTDNWLFVIGGNTTSALLTECYKYNVTTNTWTQIADLPSGRLILSAEAIGDYIYAIGGSDGTVYTNTTYKYDIAGNTWTLLPAVVPTNIGWCRSVSYMDQYIYLAGGYDGVSANYQSTVFLFDAITETWSTTVNPMPLAVFGGGFGITGNTLVYAAGAYEAGINNTVMVGTIDGGNPALINWVVAERPFPGNGKEVSGSYGANLLAETQILTHSTGAVNHQLLEAAVFPAGAIYRTHAHTWGSDAIIMAGGTPTANYIAADPGPTYVYKPGTDTWIAQENVPNPIGAHQSGTVNDGNTWKYIIASGFGVSAPDSVTQIYTQTLSGGSTFALTVSVTDGWNMVSAPGLHPVDQLVETWWSGKDPGAGVFKYAGGYVQVFSATPTEGYWMKNSGAQVYNYPPIGIVTHNSIVAAAGWNMIGGYELTVPTALLTTTPPGLITTPVFGYAGGYVAAPNIVPGYGYWVKMDAAGTIDSPPLAKGSGEVVEFFKEDWGKIILSDAAGINYTLYAVNGKVDLNKYELPPAPPSGVFDIRYGSGRIAEDLTSTQSIELNNVQYPISIRVENMTLTLQDPSGVAVNANINPGETVTIADNTINKLIVSSDGLTLPTEYALEQNYPNPFNPSTTIKFALPEAADVSLNIYNTLGEKVAQLVNSKLEAGRYSYQWEAGNIATGMYIYELRTDKFVSVKKMILLK